MLFHMIGKLSCDKKAHLPELLQAYNSTRLAVTGYSLHYLMFGWCPHLHVDYYFLMVSAYEHSRHVPAYVMEVRRPFKEAYTEAHLQTNCEAKKQKCYYDRDTSTAQLVPGDVVLMKNDAYQEKQKVKDWWSETEYVVVRGSMDGADTLSPTSRVLLGWVGGVLWLLPLMAPRLAMWRGIGAGDGVGSLSDEEVH